MYDQQFNPYAANLSVVKDYFKKGRILGMGILKLLTGVLSIVSAYLVFSNTGEIYNGLIDFYESNGVDVYSYMTDYGAADIFNTGAFVFSAITIIIVTGLPVLGYILTYAKSRNQSPNASPNAGVTILWVLAIISLVLTSAALALVLILLSLAAVLAGSSGDAVSYGGLGSGLIAGALIAVFVIFAIVAFITLFIAINRVRFYGSVRKSMNSVELQRGGAAPYGVMNIIGAVFSGLSLLSTAASLTALSLSDEGAALLSLFIVIGLSSIFTFVTYILDAVIALGYKKHIDDVKFGYDSTPYGGMPADSFIPTPGADYAKAPDEINPYANRQAPYNDGFQMNTGSTQAAYCPRCGAPDDGMAPFCGNCGNRLR